MFSRQQGIKVLKYMFDVTLSDTSEERSVKGTIDLQFLAAGIQGIDLNLCNLISEPQTRTG
jgi:hypothetical protein